MNHPLRGAIRSASAPREAALGRQVALHLLERSIGFGHGRMAVLRLSVAVHAGAAIDRCQWSYCEDVVRRSCDLGLQSLFDAAVDHARGIPADGMPASPAPC